MADTVDRATRSWIMAQVRSRNTKPERLVSKALKKLHIQFSADPGTLPGKPDLVIRKIRLAVFVNGCFWHWHGCRRSRMPAQNRAYWECKIARNVARDARSKRALRALGWHYWTVWECDLARGVARLRGKIKALEMRGL
ncbi:MAG: very short patch repair endonuclease [Bryobacteraceae bacterium]|jgi:DNA mismatch endonuclease (patch repair protein)